jgi:hypothetical protein
MPVGPMLARVLPIRAKPRFCLHGGCTGGVRPVHGGRRGVLAPTGEN